MTPLSEKEFRLVCDRGGVTRAAPDLKIGRELSLGGAPLRQLVVYIGDKVSDSYREAVTNAVFSVESGWLLFPRYGNIGDLGLLDVESEGAAIRFSEGELASLSTYLRSRPVAPWRSTADLYVLSESGQILMTWDHHSYDEGLSICFRQVPTATKVLGELNELGAELEVFFVNVEA
jgi:hypothetical protein